LSTFRFKRGADVGPDFAWNRQAGAMMDYR
jgi:hypothetical protein